MRRAFIVGGFVALAEAGALAVLMMTPPALAAGLTEAVLPAPETLRRAALHAPAPEPEVTTTRLRVEGLDGRMRLDLEPFDAHGNPIPEAFAQINQVFRAPNGHVAPIHPALVEKLMMLSEAFDGRPLALVSGHRVPGRGTRETSRHVSGRAADVLIRGVKVRDLYQEAKRLGMPGLGVYRSFIHVDVRDQPYHWGGAGNHTWPLRLPSSVR